MGGMTGTATLHTIGELARRTGLPVRTIRFYSDSGVVPPEDRSDGGYRLYGPDALARLELVRTLRDLGIDLATIRRLLEREADLADVAAVHARAVDAQIRVLRLRRAVLQAVAHRGSDPEEMQRMHQLAQLSDDERRRIVADFLDEAFAGLDLEPGFAARMRSAQPELPDDPSPEQIEAWIELAELVRDPGFRASIRRMSEQHAAAHAAGELGLGDTPPDEVDWQAVADTVNHHAGAAHAAGVDPTSAAAQQTVEAIAPAFAGPRDDPHDPAWRHGLAARLEIGIDPRAERYWQLLATVNGWPPVPTTVPAWEWLVTALRA
jgi:DNA-binding transcriptional MerR regulator